MKKIFVVVLLLLPLIASAQRTYLGIQGGLTFPSSPSGFKNYWTTSFNLGLDVDRQVADLFSVGGEFNYASFALDKSTTGVNANVTRGSFNAAQILATAKITDFSSINTVSPYGRVGLGISFTSFDDLRAPNGDLLLRGSSENGLGVMLAAGVAFNLQSGSRLTIEGSYRVNNRPGDSFNGFLVDVGYRFGL